MYATGAARDSLIDSRCVLQGPGSRYTAAVIELDLTKAGSLVERMQEALALFGHVDILINNAGTMMMFIIIFVET